MPPEPVARAAVARHSTSPESSAGARAVVAVCPGTPVGTAAVALATIPGVPGLAAVLRAPVVLAAAVPGSRSGGIAVAVVRVAPEIFPCGTVAVAVAAVGLGSRAPP